MSNLPSQPSVVCVWAGRQAYKTIRDAIMPLQHRSSELGMLVVVVLYEGFVAEAWLLFHQDGGFDDFAEAGGVWVAGFEHHGRERLISLRSFDAFLSPMRCAYVGCEVEVAQVCMHALA